MRVYQGYTKLGNSFPPPGPIMDLGRGTPLSQPPIKWSVTNGMATPVSSLNVYCDAAIVL